MKVLVLGGGNTKGCFQAGVINSLYLKGYRPDYIVGTSIGAINAWILSRTSHHMLYDFWYNIGPRSRYLRYNWRRLFIDGVFDLRPMERVLEKFSFKPNTPAKFCTVNLKTGALVYGSEMKDCIASASEPVFMRPVYGHMDGGIRDQVPLSHAKDKGGTDITVIVNNPLRENPDEQSIPKNILSIALRGIDIQTHESFLNDVRDDKHIHVYAPGRVPITRFNFNKEDIRAALNYGEEIGNREPI